MVAEKPLSRDPMVWYLRRGEDRDLRVVVIDDNDYLGRKLAMVLASRGALVRCMVPTLHGPAKVPSRVTFATAHTPGAWHFPAGSETAYYLDCSSTPLPPERLRRFAARLVDNQVQRLVHVIPWTSGDLRSALTSILAAAGIPVTEIRVGPMIGDGSVPFELIRAMVERLPVIPSASWTNAPLQPVATSDVLECLLAAPAFGPGVKVLAGASVETYSTMMAEYARARRLSRLMLPVLLPDRLWLQLAKAVSGIADGDLAMLGATTCTATGATPVCNAPTRCDEAIARAITEFELPHIRPRGAPERGTEHMILRRNGFITGQWQTRINSPVADIFAVLEALGGRTGWLFADELWQLRGAMDRLAGGPGMSPERRDPLRLDVGDLVDFWSVEALERCRLLRLRATMKMPGEAWLQFECSPNGDSTLLTQTVFYRPRGVLGELYWAALYPLHVLLFDGLHQAIAAEARSHLQMRERELALTAH